MTDKAASLMERIRDLEAELEEEFERRRALIHYEVQRGRVVFEQDIARKHAELRQKLLPYLGGARLSVVLTAPVIYAMIVPFVILDLFVTVYQAICFPAYQIEKVQRSAYITYDRQHLSYLNGLEKLNCVYCAYGNGILAYATEIAGRTEKRWCPIKHAKRLASVHRHYSEFLEYGDAEAYREKQTAKAGTPQD